MNRLLAVIALVMLAGSVPAVPPAVDEPVGPDRLVAQLGSDVYQEREAAMAALEKLGETARPALEDALRNPSPEVGKRAARVLVSVQRTSDAANKLNVKTHKLSYRKIPLGTAVNDLKARTGINLTLDPANIADPLRMVTCETGDLPPWEAVNAFCEAAGLREVFDLELPVPKQERSRRGLYTTPPPPPTPDSVPVKLVDGTHQSLPGSRNTAVRVLALPGNFAKHRVYLGTGDVLFHFDVAPMPGYHWQSVAGVRITKVVDDSNRLGAAGTNREPNGFFSEMFEGVVFAGGGGVVMGWDGEMPNRPTAYPNPRIVPVPIKLGSLSARKLKLLEGSVVCEISVPNQPLITIDNIGTALGNGVEGLRGLKMTVLDTKPSAKGGKAVLKVQVDQPPAWLNNRFNAWGGGGMMMGLEDSISLPPTHVVKGFDAAGKPVRMNVLTNSETNTDEFTQSTTTQYSCPDGLPVKIVLTGAKPVLVEVPFKMENVQLP